MMTSPAAYDGSTVRLVVDADFPGVPDASVRLFYRPAPWDGMPAADRHFRPVRTLTARGESEPFVAGPGETMIEFSPSEIFAALEGDTSVEAADSPEPPPDLYARVAALEGRVAAIESELEI